MVLCRGGVCRFLLGNILPDLWEHLPVSWSQCRLQVWILISLLGAVFLSNTVLLESLLFMPGSPGWLVPDSIAGVTELMPPGWSWALGCEQVLIRSRFMGAQFCSWKPGYSSVLFQGTLAQPGRRAGMDAPEHTEEGGWVRSHWASSSGREPGGNTNKHRLTAVPRCRLGCSLLPGKDAG